MAPREHTEVKDHALQHQNAQASKTRLLWFLRFARSCLWKADWEEARRGACHGHPKAGSKDPPRPLPVRSHNGTSKTAVT